MLPELDTPAKRVAAIADSMRALAPLAPGGFFIITGPRGGYSAAEADALAVEGLRELADVAAEIGSGVNLELFHSSLADWSYASSVAEGAALLDQVDRPNVKLAVDIWHLPEGPETLAQLRDTRAASPPCTSTTAAIRRAARATASTPAMAWRTSRASSAPSTPAATAAGTSWRSSPTTGATRTSSPIRCGSSTRSSSVRTGRAKFEAAWATRRLAQG